MNTQEKQTFLAQHIPYRMKSLSFCQMTCELLGEHGPDHELKVHFGSFKALKFPSLRLITNPIIETGLIMSRVMLEFIGVKVSRKTTKIIERKGKTDATDVICEDFGVDPIPMLALKKIFAERPDWDTENALARTILSANKGVAHLTLDTHPQLQIQDLALTCYTTNLILNSYFFGMLDMPQVELFKMNSRNG